MASSHDDWLRGLAVEQFDVAGGMGQQQLDGLDFAGIGGVVDEPPESGLTQRRALVLAGLGQPPRSGLPVEVVAAVVGDHDLLAEPVVAVGAAALALAAPHPDEGQQRQQGVVEVRALAQIRGVGGHRQIVEGRDVAGRGRFRAFGGGRDGAVAGAGSNRVRRRRESRLVGDQPVQRVQREPGDDHDRRDEQDLEEAAPR